MPRSPSLLLILVRIMLPPERDFPTVPSIGHDASEVSKVLRDPNLRQLDVVFRQNSGMSEARQADIYVVVAICTGKGPRLKTHSSADPV